MNRPYSSYKDSGIEWIGQIPKDWDIASIRALCYLGRGRVISNKEIANSLGEYPVYSSQTTENGMMGRLNTYDFNGEYVTWTTDGANAGTVFHRQGKFNCTNVCGTLKAKADKVFPKYLPYVLNLGTKCYVRYDINPKLMNNEMAGIRIPLPRIDEQKNISRYLDRKTTQIDDLIAKQEKMIELLQEEYLAVINQVVTRGLDQNVSMKDSGVLWIGQIPLIWEMRKVGRSFRYIGSGTTPDSSEQEYYENGSIPWVITGDLNDDILRDSTKKITELAFNNFSALKMFPIGAILIAMYGATIGKTAIVDFEGCCNQACCVLADSAYFYNKFVFYWFVANKPNIISLGYGGGQPNISQDAIKSLKLPCPMFEEQERIINFLDRKTAQINAQIGREQKSIKLLKEFRTSLISEVVTGKIDVRNN
ncbi:MAG: restriction endonuclease subunit S [Candidatus Omnitrophica bacterium CG02_land_8_20_14_3_00__42_8]|nr:MAG: restriction endonuclease subunit S [Candidatus Omnitrophica bacterium CG02_land_8_20_14_3_00__42_8]